MNRTARRAFYCGLLPITILIGASVGAGSIGPLSIPPKWFQSPGQGSFFASMCAERRAATTASQVAPTCSSVPDLKRTTTPIAAPAPDQFQISGSQCAWLSTSRIDAARLFGSGPSPKTYMAAFVPENGNKATTSSSLAASAISRGDLNLSSASCASTAFCAASAARAFASAISPAVFDWNFVRAWSVARVSLLCETIEPTVATPIAAAANAANTTDMISQKSQNSPFWPRNKVEAAAFALLIVSCMGGMIFVAFGVFAAIEYRRR